MPNVIEIKGALKGSGADLMLNLPDHSHLIPKTRKRVVRRRGIDRSFDMNSQGPILADPEPSRQDTKET